MTVRDVEGKLPYTGGKAISIDEHKVISLNLRDENNLIIYDEGDDEIYVDLQLPDGIRPLDAFPVGVTTGRVLVADDWDTTGTIVCFKTTSGDNIKLLYADDGKLYIDNGTGTFKQIYLKGEVDALLQALREYIDAQLALKQDKLTAGDNITIDANNVISATGCDVKMFTLPSSLSSAEALEVAQEALDWYFDGKTPVIRHENDYNIYRCSGENQSGLLTPITYWLEFDNILLAEGIVENANYRMPSSVVDSKIRFTYDETTHEVTLVERIYVQQDFLPSNSSTEVVYNPSHTWDPTTKEYVDGKDVYIGASAPTDLAQGRLWYDTTTNELKSYDGTNWNVVGFNPENSGTTGYLLTKTSTGYNWANKYTLPTSTANTGYVLKKTASSAGSYSWAAPDIGISTQSGNLLLTTASLWIGTAADYQNLGSYDMNTIYLTV